MSDSGEGNTDKCYDSRRGNGDNVSRLIPASLYTQLHTPVYTLSIQQFYLAVLSPSTCNSDVM